MKWIRTGTGEHRKASSSATEGGEVPVYVRLKKDFTEQVGVAITLYIIREAVG